VTGPVSPVSPDSLGDQTGADSATGPTGIPPAEPPGEVQRGGLGQDIGRAAVLIGTLTVLARLIGFGRQLVFTHTVGASCLGTAYTTANQVPNIIYDVVLGGALTSLMVPVLAGPALKSLADPDQAAATNRISSAVLTWTVLVLAPVSVAAALLAGPVVRLLVPSVPHGCAYASMVAVATRMLVVFAPQILLYGLAVVLYGILQAHRRFGAPALAPVVSSLVVIAAYLAFVPLGQEYVDQLPRLSSAAELTLSVGTTAGVAALAVTAALPVLRLRLRLRPALRFPAGVAARAGGLAAVGIAALIAQNLSAIVVIRLANGFGGHGALVLYGSAWQAFVVPYAVLAIPIAISAFPELATRQGPQFDDTAAASTRAVLLASSLGAALLAGAAVPLAAMFITHNAEQADQMARAMIAFAPGLIGYGLIASLSRVLLAGGRYLAAGVWMSVGWLLAIGIDVVVVRLVPAGWVVPALGLGNSAGLTAAALGLLAAVRGGRGGGALAGTLRAAAVGLGGAVAGAVAGGALAGSLRVSGFLLNAAIGVLACTCVLIVFGLAAYAGDRGDLRQVVARVRRRASQP
jgi:putative peptidoglycan lipid II flippase